MRTNLIVNGAAGRMGRRIISLAIDAGQFNIIAAIDQKSHPDIGKDIGTLSSGEPINVSLDSDHTLSGEAADVLIDFSLPEAADRSIEYCFEQNVALVLGTTGLTDEQISRVKDVSQRIPVIQATNMSVGMNVLFSLVGKVANLLGSDYDIEITEAHHRFKKDSPSGTALTLAERIAAETDRPWPGCLVHGRCGKDAVRKDGDIGMHAIRAGGIAGEHSVIFGSQGEAVTLSHNALSRDTFAQGALRAAAWLAGKPAGMYSMADVLGLK